MDPWLDGDIDVWYKTDGNFYQSYRWSLMPKTIREQERQLQAYNLCCDDGYCYE
jgi:hypothetical protein